MVFSLCLCSRCSNNEDWGSNPLSTFLSVWVVALTPSCLSSASDTLRQPLVTVASVPGRCETRRYCLCTRTPLCRLRWASRQPQRQWQPQRQRKNTGRNERRNTEKTRRRGRWERGNGLKQCSIFYGFLVGRKIYFRCCISR